ncbi:calcium-binding protein, partial [Pseudomonas sp. BN415]|uniref:calcium-binding protein n=1 Tax=Pseudomonas sp. BN415 TaxID=2567889 RepID=UPI002454A6D1
AGGTDNDRLYGGMGDDLLEGEDGDDILYGEDGNDSLDGGSGYNQLIGGEGNDSLTLGNGAGSSSYAFGGNGDDLLIAVGLASDASVSLSGESGSDTYRYDGSGNLSLSDYVNTSQAGDFNRLELAAGITPASVTVSGDGNGVTLSFVNGKTLYLSNQLASWQASDNPNQYGVQEVLFSDGTVWNRQQLRELAGYYIGGDAADDSISTGAGDQFLYGYGGHDSLAGGTDNDRLYGGMGDDLLEGEDGDDILYGEDGNDTLDGGSGVNQLFGGGGSDIFRFSDASTTASNTVYDFTQGIDHLGLNGVAFDVGGQAVADVLANVNNGQNEQDGALLVFNQSNQTLYYDADGTANGNAVAVVTLAGVSSLAAGDLQLLV